MPRRLREFRHCLAVMATGALVASSAGAQERAIRVMGDDGQPVAYATVTLQGERPKITDEKGEVEVGTAPRPAVVVDIRRLGYEPWYGTVALGDTVTLAHVSLHRLARRMFTVTVTDSSNLLPWYLRGFYERMLARQRGEGSGVYLTPEEIERRNTNLATALLQGLNGVSVQRTRSGAAVAMSTDGGCQMAVVIDGHRVCAEGGCSPAAVPPPVAATGSAGRRSARATDRALAGDDPYVLLDRVISVNDIAAIEVYPRGVSVPASFPSGDFSCGVVGIWTGGRKAP